MERRYQKLLFRELLLNKLNLKKIQKDCNLKEYLLYKIIFKMFLSILRYRYAQLIICKEKYPRFSVFDFFFSIL